MAATFVGSTTASGNGDDSGSWTLHANWQPGDTAIFWWYAVRSAASIDDPSGVGITQKQNASGAGSAAGTIFVGYRHLQSGDTTFGWTGSVAASVDVLWGVDVWRGLDTAGDPFEAQSGTAAEFTDTNDPDPPAATPVSNDAVVWAIFGKSNDYSALTPPTDYTTGGTISSTAGADGSVATAYRILSGGAGAAQDPGAWDLSGGASTDDGMVWTGVLKPAGGGGGGTSILRQMLMNH